jgi:hypothetical protein
MMLAASTGWFQQFTAWAHASLLNELWFQNITLIISAAIAILTIGTTSLLERRRATIDLVRDLQKDEVLIKARATIRSVQDESGKIDFTPILAKEDSEELRAILNVLNSFEFMAAGLRTGAFDEKTYKRILYNTVVTQWDLFQEFVVKYRENYKKENEGAKGLNADTLFQDFETLARKWSRDPLKKIRNLKRILTRLKPFNKKSVAAATQPATHPQPPVQVQAPAPSQQQTSPKPPTPPANGASV